MSVYNQNPHKYHNIAIIGFGVTGQAVARFFCARGSTVTVYESKSHEKFPTDVLSRFSNVTFHFDTLDFNPTQYDCIVTSPGASLEIPPIQKAFAHNIPVHNDLTLFIEEWRSRGHRTIGVTGSNGKTTTVSLLFEAIRHVAPAILAGNIGNSPLDLLDISYDPATVAVLEISSNQLDLFGPEHYLDVCVITNLSSNHLDRYHGSMSEYAAAKIRGIHPEKTKVIICADDSGTQKYVLPQLVASHMYVVSFEMPLDQAAHPGIYTDAVGDLVFLPKPGEETRRMFSDAQNRRLLGVHNLYNIAFVLLAIHLSDCVITPEVVLVIRTFIGLEHRVEIFFEKDGIRYVNDSKSTSPDSIRVALEAVGNDKNVILIAGGDDKDMSFDFLEPFFSTYVRLLIIIPGDIDKKLENVATRSTSVSITRAGTLSDAVTVACTTARTGDVVLLSPGSYSKNYFKDFADRGAQFKNLVMQHITSRNS